MIKQFYILLLFISFFGYSQVTILNKTDLHGFNYNQGPPIFTKVTGGVQTTGSSFGMGTLGYLRILDTTLNLIGFDSLQISFTASTWSSFGGYSTIDNVGNITGAATTYSYYTKNITNLVITCTVVASIPNKNRTLEIKDLKIIGYPTVTSINESLSGNTALTVYPNPFNDKITIVQSEKKEAVQIFNTLGSVIHQAVIENEKNEIDLSSQPAGVYFIHVGSSIRKVVKE